MILTYGDSKRGLVRKVNEDAIYTGAENLCFLADGMGGYDGGQVASSLAVQSAVRYFLSGEKSFSRESLRESFYQANQAILAEKKDEPSLQSMGTTMIGAALEDSRLYWAHVGDSRLYIYRNEELTQVTTDHSFVMELVSEGKLSKEEMRVHPRKNEITRAIGIESDLKVDTGCIDLTDDTCILICSDGVSGPLDDEKIKSILSSGERKTVEDLEVLGKKLMAAVYETGAKDNASYILIQYWN